MQWTEVNSTALAFHNDKTISNVANLEDCRKECVAENQFRCQSVEFNADTKECQLSKDQVREAESYLLRGAFSASWTYSHWYCTLGKGRCHVLYLGKSWMLTRH